MIQIKHQYFGYQIMVRTLEGGPRVGVEEKIQVCVKARYRGQLAMKLLHCWNYTTDFNSQVVFALPNISDPLNVQLITLTVRLSNIHSFVENHRMNYLNFVSFCFCLYYYNILL